MSGRRIAEWLALARRHHQEGRLGEAEPVYRQILALDPNHAKSLHLLGLLAHQVGRNEVAVEFIGKAISIDNRLPNLHVDLAAALAALGRLQEATAACQRAVDLAPDDAEAHYNLGVLLKALGRLEGAAASYRRAIELEPDFAEAHYNLGILLQELGRLDEAAASCRRAIDLRPDFAEAHCNLGLALKALGRLQEAAVSCRQAIDLKPDYAEAHYNLGIVLQELDRLDEAAASYRHAIELEPDFAEAHCNLGGVLQKLDRPSEAAICSRRAIDLKPDSAEAHSNLGGALQKLGRLDEALAACRRAVELKPDFAEAHNNLGVVLRELGDPDEAAAAGRRAVELKPDWAVAGSNWLFGLNYMADVSLEALLAEHRGWDERHGGAWKLAADYANDRDPERRLRIGYVSGDFRTHPVGHFMVKPLASHDRAAVESFCYSNEATVDGVTERLRGSADHWRSLVGVSDEDASAMIQRDGIDILIDLSGHTDHGRLLLFARRPAPVQASWLGYPATTGLSAIDYLLMDAAAIPPGAERWCSEAVVRLPHGRFCYAPPDYAPEVADPALRRKAPVTFGSFNNLAKVRPEVARLWTEVLKATPGSKLVLKWTSLAEPGMRRRVQQAFAEAGLAPERLELRGPSPHADMLAEYGEIDIALDPFPFCGGLTSCEALWMGVPVVTLPGDRPASRQTLGFLDVLGLQELAAASEADYVRIAAGLAADPDRRAELRATLRARMTASPLLDGALFTPALDRAFRQMWRRWCVGESPAAFDVPASGPLLGSGLNQFSVKSIRS